MCHGPHAHRVEADLRLDLEDAVKEYTVVPGEPQTSEVFVRISSTNAEMRMLPSDSNLSLTLAEIETIHLWIEQGAPYDEHWAFKLPPDSVDQPAVEDSDCVRRPLDVFVLATLEIPYGSGFLSSVRCWCAPMSF